MHIMAIDRSGSTGGIDSVYWKLVREIISKEETDAKFILWDNKKITGYTPKEQLLLDEEPKFKGGEGCTDPGTFIDFLKSQKNSLSSPIIFTLITDGEVSPDGGKVEKEDKIKLIATYEEELKALNIRFSELRMYFISTDSENKSMDLSVSAPFIRIADKYELEVYNLLSDRSGSVLLLDDEKSIKLINRLNLGSYYDNPAKFNLEAHIILKSIRVENSGRNPEQLLDLRNSLLELKQNLLNKILSDKRKNQEEKNSYTKLREYLTAENAFDQAVSFIKEIIASENLTQPKSKNPDILAKMQENIENMLEFCDEGIGFSFHNTSNRLARAEKNNQAVNPLKIADLENGAYECAISCKSDAALLLVRKNKNPVFYSIEKKFLDNYLNNPLSILNHQELTKNIGLIIDQHIGLMTVKRLIGNKNSSDKFEILSPQTREIIGSFISMGNSEPEIRASNFALSEIFFGGNKLLGPPALWLAVVYFFLEENGRYNTAEEDIQFMNAFKASLIARLKSDSSRMTLSGDPNVEPFIECPLDIALWYCAISWKFHENGINNRLRGVVTKYHLKLLDLLGYTYPKEQTIRQLMRYQIFAIMMREETENSSNLRNWLRCLYQNSMRLEDGSIILLDGESALKPELFRVTIEIIDFDDPKKEANYLHQLPVKQSQAHQNNQHDKRKSTLKLIATTELDKTSDEANYSLPIDDFFALRDLLDKDKKTADITIPNDLKLDSIPVAKNNYGYSAEDDLLAENFNHEISPHTMRPLIVDRLGKDWKAQAKETYGCEVSEQLSAHSFYINYVIEKEEYPSKDEFINYMANKQAHKKEGSKDTLPKCIKYIDEAVISNYLQEIKKQKLPEKEFIKKAKDSIMISKRFELDGSDLRLLKSILSEKNCELNKETIAEVKKTFYDRSLELSNGENKIYKDEKTFELEFKKLSQKYRTENNLSAPDQFFEEKNSHSAGNTQSANDLSTYMSKRH